MGVVGTTDELAVHVIITPRLHKALAPSGQATDIQAVDEQGQGVAVGGILGGERDQGRSALGPRAKAMVQLVPLQADAEHLHLPLQGVADIRSHGLRTHRRLGGQGDEHGALPQHLTPSLGVAELVEAVKAEAVPRQSAAKKIGLTPIVMGIGHANIGIHK